MPEIVSPTHWQAALTVRALLATLRDNEALIRLGAYRQGTDPVLDVALSLRDELMAFLQQGRDETAPFPETVAWICRIMERQRIADGE
jgi:flagellum-specific ATP synthase